MHVLVPTFVAVLVASLVGWLVDDSVSAILGPVPSLAAGLVVSTLAFTFAKRFISDLRAGS